MSKNDSRFQVISKEFVGSSTSCRILKDKRTGVLYLFTTSNHRGGLTPLIDQNGKPLIDRGSYRNCVKCGRQNADGNKFCVECGSVLASN